MATTSALTVSTNDLSKQSEPPQKPTQVFVGPFDSIPYTIPPYRCYTSRDSSVTNILSIVHPSHSNINQLCHLFQVSLPIRYNSHYFDALLAHQSNPWFRAQVMTLTSLANNLANATVLKSIATPQRVETEQTSEIHLHQSVFKPAVLNPLDPQLSEVIRQHFPSQSHYIQDMAQLRFPEFADDATTENKDQQATYLETEQPYPNNVLHDREVVHQVIGSYIVRPALDSPASPTPELYKQPQLPPPSSQHHPQRLDGSYIATLALAPQFLGSGMGSLLLFSCIEFCKLNYNPRFVSLHVLASNTRAIALYTRFGFIIQQRVPMFQFPAHLIGVPAAQKGQHEINKHGLVILEDGAILRQSYVLPPDETGDVLFLYLDIEQWNTTHQHIVSKWMERKLHLHVK